MPIRLPALTFAVVAPAMTGGDLARTTERASDLRRNTGSFGQASDTPTVWRGVGDPGASRAGGPPRRAGASGRNGFGVTQRGHLETTAGTTRG